MVIDGTVALVTGGGGGLRWRHRIGDAACRVRVRAVRHPCDDDRAGPLPDRDERRACSGGAPDAGGGDSLSVADGPAGFACLVLQIIENPILNREVIRIDSAVRLAPE